MLLKNGMYNIYIYLYIYVYILYIYIYTNYPILGPDISRARKCFQHSLLTRKPAPMTNHHPSLLSRNIYIYIYIYACLCVCVCKDDIFIVFYVQQRCCLHIVVNADLKQWNTISAVKWRTVHEHVADVFRSKNCLSTLLVYEQLTPQK